MMESPIGLVLESNSFDSGVAAVKFNLDIRPGSFLRVVSLNGVNLLVLVSGVRSAGGIFTEKTAQFHLERLEDVKNRVRSTFQLLDLRFVATIKESGIIDRRPETLLAGSRVFPVNIDELRSYLDLQKESGFRLGEHARHSGLEISVSPKDLREGHMAILGQTGSGKTNVLRLIHSGIHNMIGDKSSYVIFDFHDEFDRISEKEMYLHPPFSFGPGDIQLDILLDLLPGLSVPQQDILAVALDRNPTSLESLMRFVVKGDGGEASKRVILRRLQRLERSSAFGTNRDIGGRVAKLAEKPGKGTIIRFGTVQTELAQLFIAKIVRRIMYERMEERLPPMLFLVDEAHRLMSSTSSQTARNTFRFVAQEGRKFGITMVLATQRPSLLDATILSQCGTMLTLRLTSNEDARAVTQVMTEIKPSDLGTLGVGQGLLSRSRSMDVLWTNFDLSSQTLDRNKRSIRKTPIIQQELF